MKFDDMEKFIREARSRRFEPGDSTSVRMQAKFEEMADGFESLRNTLERLDETVDRFLRGVKQRRQQSGGESK